MYEFYIEKAKHAVSSGMRSEVEADIISAGAEADAGMEIYGASTYWQRAMSEAAHAYASRFGLEEAMEAEYRLLVE